MDHQTAQLGDEDASGHYNFPDPAKATGTEEEINLAFSQVRDIIKDYCMEFVKNNL